MILDFLRCTVNLMCQQCNGHAQRLGAVLLASDGGKAGCGQLAGNRSKLEDATLRYADRVTVGDEFPDFFGGGGGYGHP